MELISIWTKCKTKIGGYEWIITEIWIKWDAILYNVSYNQDWLKNLFFYEIELDLEDTKKETIWFKIQENGKSKA